MVSHSCCPTSFTLPPCLVYPAANNPCDDPELPCLASEWPYLLLCRSCVCIHTTQQATWPNCGSRSGCVRAVPVRLARLLVLRQTSIPSQLALGFLLAVCFHCYCLTWHVSPVLDSRCVACTTQIMPRELITCSGCWMTFHIQCLFLPPASDDGVSPHWIKSLPQML